MRLAFTISLFASLGLAQSVTWQPNAAPTPARPGTTVTVTGSGFPAGTIDLASLVVTLEPRTPGAGPTVTFAAATLQTVLGTTRRVGFTIPASMPLMAAADYLVSVAGGSGPTAFTSANKAALRIEAGTATWTVTPEQLGLGLSATVRITAPPNTFVAGATTAAFGAGVRVGGAAAGTPGVVNVPDTQTALVPVQVENNAALGARDITVRVASLTMTLPGRFTVVAAPATPPPSTAPTLTSVLPNLANPGGTLTIAGTAFPNLPITASRVTARLEPATPGAAPSLNLPASSINPATGTDRTFQVALPTTLSVAQATQYFLGISGTTDSGLVFASTNRLALIIAPATGAPRLISLSPATGTPGQTLTVTITGENFPAVPSLPVSFGAGISVGGLAEGLAGQATRVNATTLSASIRIGTAAATGARAVIVALPTGQTLTSPVPFVVGGADATLTSVIPNFIVAGTPTVLTIRGTNSSFAAGRTQVSFGDGVTVSNLTVASATQLSVTAQASLTATLGARNLTVTTDGRALVLPNALTVNGAGRLLSLSPPTGSTGTSFTITVTGERTAFQTQGMTANLGSGINLGSIVASSQTSFTARVEILPTAPAGSRTLTVAYGGQTLALADAFTVTGPTISILTPTNLSFVNTPAITVTGRVSDQRATIAVNGITAPNTSGSFTTSVPLQEGNNTISAVATTPEGAAVSSSIQITLDTTPPRIAILSPSPNQETTEASISVTGSVNDIVVGTVNDQEAQVTVNGVRAAVANRSFEARNVPVALGSNTIRVEARDRVGNPASATVTVARKAMGLLKMSIVSGNYQSAPVMNVLAQPLVVRLTDDFDQPIANRSVFFRVAQNNGLVGAASNDASKTAVEVKTDASGQARAFWKLGERSGAGNNRAEAYTTGLTAPAVFSASGTNGTPTRIVIDSGLNQTGAVNDKLPLPFVAVVTDANHNRLGGVPVTFTVRQGGGKIDGLAEKTFTSDSDGRVAAVLELGPNEGIENNEVVVNFSGNTNSPAIFTATGRIPRLLADTRVTGTVFDNANQPIPGVTMRLYRIQQGTTTNLPVQVGTPVQTNDKGYFEMVGAPVGVFKLMADGTTVPGAKKYPTLEFDLTIVSGNNNSIGSPIYLPVLDTVNRLCVDEATGGTLTLPDVPGFSLTVAPGSATFPGGSRKGCVSVTPVNIDKVPMTPGFGQQPQFVVTIQPVGTSFHPPAALSIPNTDGLLPRATTELYSYDHDLASFVSIGQGVVHEDGLRIQSLPGNGVTKAGWHCGGNPLPTGQACQCAKCEVCVRGLCRPVEVPLYPELFATDATVPACGACEDRNDNPNDCLKQVCRGGVLREEPDDSERPDGPKQPGVAQLDTFIGVPSTIGKILPISGRLSLKGSIRGTQYDRCCQGKKEKTTTAVGRVTVEAELSAGLTIPGGFPCAWAMVYSAGVVECGFSGDVTAISIPTQTVLSLYEKDDCKQVETLKSVSTVYVEEGKQFGLKVRMGDQEFRGLTTAAKWSGTIAFIYDYRNTQLCISGELVELEKGPFDLSFRETGSRRPIDTCFP